MRNIIIIGQFLFNLSLQML